MQVQELLLGDQEPRLSHIQVGKGSHLWPPAHANSSSLCKDLFGQPHIQKAGWWQWHPAYPDLRELSAMQACAPSLCMISGLL